LLSGNELIQTIDFEHCLSNGGQGSFAHVPLNGIVYRGREAQLDQVRNRGKVTEDIERTHVRMIIRLDGDSNRTH